MAISNGHAARMRYSRFKSQIDPSTAHKNAKKKNTKKGEKGKQKGAFSVEMNMEMPMNLPTQMSFPWANSGLVLKAEPSHPHYQHHPFLKCEPGHENAFGDQNFLAGTESQYDLARMTPPNSMASFAHLPPSSVHQYAGHEVPFPMAPGMAKSLQMSSSSRFTSYPTMQFSQDFSIQDFPMQQPIFSNAPMITWEPPISQQRELTPVTSHHTTPVTVKEEPKHVQEVTEVEVPIKGDCDQPE